MNMARNVVHLRTVVNFCERQINYSFPEALLTSPEVLAPWSYLGRKYVCVCVCIYMYIYMSL